MRHTDVMQNNPSRPKNPSPHDLFDAQDDDEPEDNSIAAFESLLAAQQRMKGIVECAGALNRLLAEAAEGSSMPLNLPPLPPAFLAAAAAVRAQEERAMNLRAMSHVTSPGSSSDSQEIPAAGYGRLEALIRMRGFITNSDMREAFEMSPIQATMRLKDLVAQRVLVQRGQRRGARYSTGPRWPPKT
jgi:hypothetical protein